MSSANSTNPSPFEAARAHLIARLTQLVPPKSIRVFPGPGDFIAARDFLKDVASLCDELLEIVGGHVEENSPYNIDTSAFDGAFSAAVSDAAYACETVAEKMQDDRRAA